MFPVSAQIHFSVLLNPAQCTSRFHHSACIVARFLTSFPFLMNTASFLLRRHCFLTSALYVRSGCLRSLYKCYTVCSLTVRVPVLFSALCGCPLFLPPAWLHRCQLTGVRNSARSFCLRFNNPVFAFPAALQ